MISVVSDELSQAAFATVSLLSQFACAILDNGKRAASGTANSFGFHTSDISLTGAVRSTSSFLNYNQKGFICMISAALLCDKPSQKNIQEAFFARFEYGMTVAIARVQIIAC